MFSESNSEQNLANLRIGRNFLTDRKGAIKFVLFEKIRIPFCDAGHFFIIAKDFAAFDL